MRPLLLILGVFISGVVVGTSCSSRPTPTAPAMTAKWEFAAGLGDWQTLHSDDAELVHDGDVAYLRLHEQKKNPHGGHIWNKIRLDQRPAARVSVMVVAKAVAPPLLLSIGIACQTGKQDGPTYGVLAANDMDYHLTSDWATYKMALEIPKGTRELELSISIDVPQSDDASLDIRSVEYLIDEDRD